MPAAALPPDEATRLAALHRLGILDSSVSAEFAALARTAALICGTPIALVSLVDRDRQWLCANIGLPGVSETARDVAFCAHAILGDDMLEVPDATLDARFSDNPLVTGDPNIRFYAGTPLHLQDGSRVGTLCVIDRAARGLDETQREALSQLGTAVSHALESWHARKVAAQLAERLTLATAGCGIGIWERDLAADHLTWDDMNLRLFGGAPGDTEDVMGLWDARVHPDDHAAVARTMAASLAGQRVYDVQFRVVWPDGSLHYLKGLARTVRDAGGRPVRLIGVNWDITEHVEAQAALREQDERLRLLLNGVRDDAIYMLDPEGKVASWNTGAARLKGYEPSEIIGRHFSVFFTEADVAAGEPARVLGIATEAGNFHGEAWRVRRDGSRFLARVSLSALRDSQGTLLGYAKVAQDLTEQRLVAAQQATLIEAAQTAMLVIDEHGLITLANTQAHALFGYAAGSLAGKDVAYLVPKPQAADAATRHAFAAHGEGGQSELRAFEGCRADGSRFPVDVLLRPVSTEHGNIMVATVLDATERQRQAQAQAAAEAAERAAVAATQARLEQLARHLGRARDQAQHANEAKSRFLASISHELRTPLNGILGYAQLLRLEGALQLRQREQVDEMLGAGEHLLGMINAVLDLSQIESDRLELQPKLLELPDFAQKCLGVVRPSASAKALELRLLMAPDAPSHLIADPTRLRQVLVNLLGNAVKFTSAGGVELRVLLGDARGELRFEVADTGPGIPEPQREKLFREFTRLEGDGAIEGTGLGLAITARLVQRMGGRIGHMANRAGGSVFWLELPLGDMAGSPDTDAETQPGEPPAAPRLRILVVDDVELNRKIARSFLVLDGHEVVCVTGGEEAIAAVQAGSFDLVLMDVQMPVIDGLQATRRIRALPPPFAQIPVIAMTAQAFADQITDCLQAGMNAHVAKPLEYTALQAAISRAHAQSAPKTPSDWVPRARSPAVLDRAHFEATACLLSPADLALYLATLRARTQMLLALLENAAGSTDIAGIAGVVHEVRGSAGTFGFRRLDVVGENFERAVMVGAPGIGLLAGELAGVVSETLAALAALAAAPVAAL